MKPQRVVEPSEEVAPKQSTKALEIPKDLDHQFSKMLRELVYPQLQEALLDICEKMADDGEIRKYLETNLEQRVFDHEEKRQIESRLLREQFGKSRLNQVTSTPTQMMKRMRIERQRKRRL